MECVISFTRVHSGVKEVESWLMPKCDVSSSTSFYYIEYVIIHFVRYKYNLSLYDSICVL